MLCDENLGYHEENWKARRPSGVREGKSFGRVTAEGIKGLRERKIEICPRVQYVVKVAERIPKKWGFQIHVVARIAISIWAPIIIFVSAKASNQLHRQ